MRITDTNSTLIDYVLTNYNLVKSAVDSYPNIFAYITFLIDISKNNFLTLMTLTYITFKLI